MKTKIKAFAAAVLAVSMLTTVALAAPNPYEKDNRSFISITGDVASSVSAKGVGFTLDYGDGLISVEVDDHDLDDDSAGIRPGERVTVYGRIDDDLFEIRSIEASSVFAHERNMYYFADSADEEGWNGYTYTYSPLYPTEGSWLTVSGKVTSVENGGNEFEIDTGVRQLQVETQELGYNPLDDLGFQQITVGDRVSVTGVLDTDFFDEDDIIASSIVTIYDEKKKEG